MNITHQILRYASLLLSFLLIILTAFFALQVIPSLYIAFSAVNIVGVALLIAGLTGAIKQKVRYSKTTTATLSLFVGIIIVAFAVLAWGFAQDLSGKSCSGFWGALTTCADNSFFIVNFVATYAFVFPVIGLAAGIAGALQLRHNRRA